MQKQQNPNQKMPASVDMLYVPLFLLVLVTSWLAFERIRRRNYPPGPWGLPLVGSILSVRGEAHKWFLQLSKQYKSNVIFLRLGTVDVVVLNDWRCISKALTERDKEFSARPSSLIWKIGMRSTGSTFGQGPQWKKEKTFAVKQIKARMATFEADIQAQVQQTVDFLRRNDGHKVCVTDLFFTPVFNVMVKFLTGKKQFNEGKTSFLKTNIKEALLYGGSNYWMNFFPFLRYVLDYDTRHRNIKCHRKVEGSLAEDIDRHLEDLDEDNPTKTFLNAYLLEMRRRPEDKTLTMESLMGTSTSFFYGGVETVETTLVFAFLYFALWPEIQKRVQREIDEVVGRSRSPAYSDHALMPYTEATILEVHRFSTIQPFPMPRATFAQTQFEGYTIPKDAYVLVSNWAISFDEELWGDPEVFRPERFLDPDGSLTRPDHLIPFSKGLRVCPGKPVAVMQIFLHVTSLLQQFSFHQVTGEAPLSLKTETGLNRRPQPFQVLVRQRS